MDPVVVAIGPAPLVDVDSRAQKKHSSAQDRPLVEQRSWLAHFRVLGRESLGIGAAQFQVSIVTRAVQERKGRVLGLQNPLLQLVKVAARPQIECSRLERVSLSLHTVRGLIKLAGNQGGAASSNIPPDKVPCSTWLTSMITRSGRYGKLERTGSSRTEIEWLCEGPRDSGSGRQGRCMCSGEVTPRGRKRL